MKKITAIIVLAAGLLMAGSTQAQNKTRTGSTMRCVSFFEVQPRVPGAQHVELVERFFQKFEVIIIAHRLLR